MNKLILTIQNFCKIAQTHSYTTFHGTKASNVPSILQKGLISKKPNYDTIKGVYLTPDIQKAAYYSVEHHNPEYQSAILEITISGKHRTKKIIRDPLDTFEGAYDIEETEIDNAFGEFKYQLSNDISKIFNIDYNDFRYSLPQEIKNIIENISYDDDLSDLRGLNIYKLIIQKAREENYDIQKLKAKIKQVIPPGKTYADQQISIANDGSFVIEPSFYENMHQQIYPKNIPPAAIKFVWLNKIDDPNIGLKRIKIKSKVLPNEAADIKSDLQKIVTHYAYAKSLDQEKMNDVIDELLSTDRYKNYSDIIEEIVMSAENNDQKMFQSYLENLGYSLDDEWLDEMYGSTNEFVKFEKSEAIKYIK